MNSNSQSIRLTSGFCGAGNPDHPVVKALQAGHPVLDGARRECLKTNAQAESGLLFSDFSPDPVFYKRYPSRWRNRILGHLGIRSRARRVWEFSTYLKGHNAPVATPLAYLDGSAESWFFCEALPQHPSLNQWLEDDALPDAALLSEQAAQAIATLHNAGVVHRDFKWGNVLFSATGDLIIADLDGARFHHQPRRADLARDLARFSVNGLEVGLTQSWARSFIGRYCKIRGIPVERLLPAVARSVTVISKRHQKRYRRPPVSLT
ncbi:lipopolysaccharide kinase InaA family protein [Thioalkalivibrio sp. AKL10]|uniref:protein kinase domain-containing protein n=1 Tax=Thioalkalivibrio sp. AKL10 TaxID=1158158 RepID=UPI0009DA99CD|nr:lipopolysaccharide kinase InaA family protein [Thioalkalivibrio sp. AKL10]